MISQEKSQKIVEKSSFFSLLEGVKNNKKWSKNGQKIDFLKSVQTLSPMSWVLEDRLTGLFSFSKRFGDHFCFRRKNCKKNTPKIVFFQPFGGGKNDEKLSKNRFFEKCSDFITDVMGV